jgi:ectoine hydroxylase-related dioxygenase (phytanoyl-CoA dioxygenase family)
MSLSKSVLEKALAEDGFSVVKNVIDTNSINLLIQEIALANNSTFVKQRRHSTYAFRNALLIPTIYSLAHSQPVVSLANSVLKAEASPVKAFVFDKTPAANWKVAWHQDLTIAVKKYRPAPGFSNWSEKAGIVHVQPPIKILENLLTLRIHLDKCDRDNGALKIIPGSHRYGKLAVTDIEQWKKLNQVHTCEVQAGDILVMRPLLLHSSSPATNPTHRRVLHLEFAAINLPDGLEWCDSTN